MSVLVPRNKLYTCRRCEMIFRFKSTRIDHEKTCNKTCKICGKELLTSKSRKYHEGKCAVKCKTCGKDFELESIKIEHQRNCVVRCTNCVQLFTSSRAEHEKCCVANGNVLVTHSCGNCNQLFLLESHRNDHERTCYLTCKVCKKIFAHRVTRRRHEANCNKMFNDYIRRVEHENNRALINKPSEIFSCGNCDQVFSLQQDRNDHEKTCNLTCKMCGKTFAESFTRAQHETNCTNKDVFPKHIRREHAYCQIEHDKRQIEHDKRQIEHDDSQMEHEESCPSNTKSSKICMYYRRMRCKICKLAFSNAFLQLRHEKRCRQKQSTSPEAVDSAECSGTKEESTKVICSKTALSSSAANMVLVTDKNYKSKMVCKFCMVTFASKFSRTRHENYCKQKQFLISSAAVDSRIVDPKLFEDCNSSSSDTEEMTLQNESLPSENERNVTLNTGSRQNGPEVACSKALLSNGQNSKNIDKNCVDDGENGALQCSTNPDLNYGSNLQSVLDENSEVLTETVPTVVTTNGTCYKGDVKESLLQDDKAKTQNPNGKMQELKCDAVPPLYLVSWPPIFPLNKGTNNSHTTIDKDKNSQEDTCSIYVNINGQLFNLYRKIDSIGKVANATNTDNVCSQYANTTPTQSKNQVFPNAYDKATKMQPWVSILQNNLVTCNSDPSNVSLPKNPKQQPFCYTEVSDTNRYTLQNTNTVSEVICASDLRDSQTITSTNDITKVNQCIPDLKLRTAKSPSAENKTIETKILQEQNINKEKSQSTCSFCRSRSFQLNSINAQRNNCSEQFSFNFSSTQRSNRSEHLPFTSYSKKCSVCLDALEHYMKQTEIKCDKVKRKIIKIVRPNIPETNPPVNFNVDKKRCTRIPEGGDLLSSEMSTEEYKSIKTYSSNNAIRTQVFGSTSRETATKASDTGKSDVTPEELLYSFKTDDGSVCLKVISLSTDRDPFITKSNEKILPDPVIDVKPDILDIKEDPDLGLSQDVSSPADYDPMKIIKMEVLDDSLS